MSNGPLYTSTLKYYKFSTRVGTMVDRKEGLKQDGALHDIK